MRGWCGGGGGGGSRAQPRPAPRRGERRGGGPQGWGVGGAGRGSAVADQAAALPVGVSSGVGGDEVGFGHQVVIQEQQEPAASRARARVARTAGADAASVDDAGARYRG